jgi:lipopolysaccharide transport system ATP-binding protein
MSYPIIKVEGLGKRYFIGHEKAERYTALRDVIMNNVKSIGKNFRQLFNDETASISGDEIEAFWALKDLDFEINQGDAIGIMGRNGAGKSTLLKVLSRITEPTSGRIEIRGRMASLLEVGTGFHPELSGRENIYLNGAILGMARAEIKRKFDEIVDFSGVEKFLDTPVKRYSSGMYVRLAFAVAAHLESEILIVDEVLAVGDAEFQKKCLGKMSEVSAGEGRTVLFVSHNMASIRQFCNRALLLDKGQIIGNGGVSEIIKQYVNHNSDITNNLNNQLFIEDPKKEFQLLSVDLFNNLLEKKSKFECDDEIIIQLSCISRVSVPGLYGYLTIENNEGVIIWASDTFDTGSNCLDNLKPNFYKINIVLPSRVLGHGEYLVNIAFQSAQSLSGFFIDNPGFICSFAISDNYTDRGNQRLGYISNILNWEIIN